mgnify:FL=1
MNTFQFEEGLQRVKTFCDEKKSEVVSPVLIGIYGHPHSGKTELISRLESMIDGRKRIKAGHINNPRELDYVSDYFKHFQYFFLHLLPSERVLIEKITLDHLGKIPDLNILIYNPDFTQSLSYIYSWERNIDDLFDFVVENKNSRVKHIY